MNYRRFETVEEIQALDGFMPVHPVTLKEFSKLVGYYVLKTTLECCFSRESSLCRKKHKFGYVVRLIDGSASIIGNDCATDNFAADNSFARDHAALDREISRHRSLKGLAQYVNQSDSLLAAAQSALEELGKVGLWSQLVCEKLGPRVTEHLRRRRRAGSLVIQIGATKVRTAYDKNTQRNYTDRFQTTPIVGRIPNIDFLEDSVAREVAREIRAGQAALQDMSEDKKRRSAQEIARLSKAIQSLAPAASRAHRLREQMEAFLAADLRPMYFLSSNREDQLGIAALISKLKDEPFDRLSALKDIERTISDTQEQVDATSLQF